MKTIILTKKDASEKGITVSDAVPREIILNGFSGKCTVRLKSLGANVSVFGSYDCTQNSRTNLSVSILHLASNTTSKTVVRSAVARDSRFSFVGNITVKKNAKNSTATLSNDNLLCAKSAIAETRPTLSILTKDARCSHAATASTFDAQQISYARTRGISTNRAKSIIKKGFLEIEKTL